MGEKRNIHEEKQRWKSMYDALCREHAYADAHTYIQRSRNGCFSVPLPSRKKERRKKTDVKRLRLLCWIKKSLQHFYALLLFCRFFVFFSFLIQKIFVQGLTSVTSWIRARKKRERGCYTFRSYNKHILIHIYGTLFFTPFRRTWTQAKLFCLIPSISLSLFSKHIATIFAFISVFIEWKITSNL